jgi:hypothetical protein
MNNQECCNHNCNQGRDCPLRNVWTSCVACGQRVTGDSIHTCSPQLKELTMTDDEVMVLWNEQSSHPIDFARAILRKASEK